MYPYSIRGPNWPLNCAHQVARGAAAFDGDFLTILREMAPEMFEPVEDGGGESEDVLALRAELESESLGALTRRAVSAMAGAPNGAAMQSEFDEAMEGEDPKGTLIRLLLLALSSSRL